MIIRKQQTTQEGISKNHQIWDYKLPNEKIGVSYQELNGRVPEKGWGINETCFEVYYVISGKAKANIDKNVYDIESGDLVVLEPHHKSYLEANNLQIITITNPNWLPEQYKEIL